MRHASGVLILASALLGAPCLPVMAQVASSQQGAVSSARPPEADALYQAISEFQQCGDPLIRQLGFDISVEAAAASILQQCASARSKALKATEAYVATLPESVRAKNRQDIENLYTGATALETRIRSYRAQAKAVSEQAKAVSEQAAREAEADSAFRRLLIGYNECLVGQLQSPKEQPPEVLLANAEKSCEASRQQIATLEDQVTQKWPAERRVAYKERLSSEIQALRSFILKELERLAQQQS